MPTDVIGQAAAIAAVAPLTFAVYVITDPTVRARRARRRAARQLDRARRRAYAANLIRAAR